MIHSLFMRQNAQHDRLAGSSAVFSEKNAVDIYGLYVSRFHRVDITMRAAEE